MKIGKKLYVTSRRAWRAWLKAHHANEREIWLVYYRKESAKPRIPYNDAVEEALCFGWIDSVLKKIDRDRFAQRFSPRKHGSQLSAMNRERVRRLIRARKMTPAGLEAIRHHFVDHEPSKPGRPVIPAVIRRALKRDRTTWKHFLNFPGPYKRIRIGWIVAAKHRPAVFKQRLQYFLRMTKRNKKFGMVR